MLTLFDYDYSQQTVDLDGAVKELQKFFKEKGNPVRTQDFSSLSGSTIRLFPELEEKGYIRVVDGMVELKEEYRDYHSVEELLAIFHEVVDAHLAAGGNHYDIYGISTQMSLMYHTPGFSRALEKEVDEYGIKLGLEHFLSVPKSRGHRMGRADGKERRWIVDAVAESVLPLDDWREVKVFFDTHAFYLGQRRAADGQLYDDILTFSGRAFKYQCFAQAQDKKTVELILSYMGGGFSGKGRSLIKKPMS
ncbi:hypothetical protein [Aneurinibacillus thermoaerophilus]|uniref:hypothetical protein n=1 Tax=Aneurinibacillus thermoaerophilus TaxID=143495 RepID=UPI002E1DCFCC|nr:hypothetical protein [Aneurinibacillus thermoaerophilus]